MMKKVVYLIVLATLIGIVACTPRAQEKTQLRVLFAGSLIIPFDEMEREFEKTHPDVDVLMDGHGSIQVIRHVTELEEEADVLAVADYSLIPMMMYEAQMPGTDEHYADWHLKFATNRIGIAYTPQSKYAAEIGEDNWYKILSRSDVNVGLSDPRFDACGYRSLMICQLAELCYGDGMIFEDLLGSRFTMPIRASEDDGMYTILVPEILEPKKGGGVVLRGASVQLLALLESGDLDYAFEYASVARQHGLEFLELPPEINLGIAEHESDYAHVKVNLAFQRFATVNPEFESKPIIYGITIPNNAPHPNLALAFVKFVVGPQGQTVMERNGQPPIVPPVADDRDALPPALRALVK